MILKIKEVIKIIGVVFIILFFSIDLAFNELIKVAVVVIIIEFLLSVFIDWYYLSKKIAKWIKNKTA